jgi:hypothetical protein
MAGRRNGVWYEGRLVNSKAMPRGTTVYDGSKGQCRLFTTRTGRRVLELLVAESFREKNSSAPDAKKDPTKGPDDYVEVAVAWHRIRVWDDTNDTSKLDKLVRDANFNAGAVVVVDASYREDPASWVDGAGVTRINRREDIFLGSEDGGSISYKDIDGQGKTFGAAEGFQIALWDGVSELPALGGSGGGAPAAPEYSDGF